MYFHALSGFITDNSLEAQLPTIGGDDTAPDITAAHLFSVLDQGDTESLREDLAHVLNLIQTDSGLDDRIQDLENAVETLFFCAEEVVESTVTLPSAGSATISIGPQYGDETKSETFTTGAAVTLDALTTAFSAVTAGSTVTMPALATAHDAVTVGGTVTLPNMGLAHDGVAVGATVTADAHATEFAALTTGATVTAPEHGLAHNTLTIGGTVTMPQSDLAHTKVTAGSTISEMRFLTSEIIAGKDLVVNNPAACVGAGGNRDGQDLEIDGSTTTPRISFMAWDLSIFPSNATVTAATLYVECKTAGTSGTNYTLHEITDGNETWNETTVVCSDAPGSNGSMQTWSSAFDSTGAKSLALNSTALSRIEERMGAGYFTIRMQGGALQLTTAVLESKDEGTNDAKGPRIHIEFTVPIA